MFSSGLSVIGSHYCGRTVASQSNSLAVTATIMAIDKKRYSSIGRPWRRTSLPFPLGSVCRPTTRNYTNRNLLTLKDRGLISDIFPENNKSFIDACNSGPQVMYAGFDPTAESLHVGNLAVIMLLLQAQRAGHSPIALVGGATGRIGDPSFKNTERPELDEKIVNENTKQIIKNIETVFANHANIFWDNKNGMQPLTPVRIVNNLDWYKNLKALELIGKIGRHFRLGQMLGRQSVASRLVVDAPISYTEFSYQVFQAYDWLHLFRTYDCNFQIGGHDQMGNIVSGHDIISRIQNKQVFGITVPLITSESGNKYGKTAGNAIWLDPHKTSPFELYQFFIRSKDSEVENLLNMFTFLQDTEIKAIVKEHQLKPEKRRAQKELAKNVSLLVHGEAGLTNALNTTSALYSENLEALAQLNAEDILKAFKSPGGTVGTSQVTLEPGTTILDMAVKGGCFQTQSDAVRIISAGGFFINYQRVSNFEEVIVPGIHILPNQLTLARVGKKNYYIIKWDQLSGYYLVHLHTFFSFLMFSILSSFILSLFLFGLLLIQHWVRCWPSQV